MIRLLLLIPFIFLFASCKTSEQKTTNTTYFGGEIINPTSDYVYLSNTDDEKLDSVKLNDDNTFLFEIDSLKSGIYHFSHKPQYQYVYLEKGDSLLVRLNTIEFDESIVFSGNGEEVNNYLLDMFLINEKEESFIRSYYRLDAEAFIFKMDSLNAEKQKTLDDFLVQYTTYDNEVKDLLKISSNYANYYHREIYPYMHKKVKGLKTIQELPESYYTFRKNIDRNLKKFIYFKPYYDYINSFFFYKAYTECIIPCGFDSTSDKDRLHYYLHKMKIIDSLTQIEELSNLLISKNTREYFFKGNTIENNEILLANFKGFNSSKKHQEEIKDLLKVASSLQKGRPFPNLVLLDVHEKKVNLPNMLKNKKTLIYFWSSQDKNHFKNIIRKIHYYKKKYKHVDFIGISLNTPLSDWKTMTKSALLKNTQQYFSEDFNTLVKKLLIAYKNKAIVIDKNGIIVDAFSNVYGNTTKQLLSNTKYPIKKPAK